MMAALIKLDDYDSKKKALLEIRDSYTRDTQDFIAYLDKKGLELDLKGLLAYNKYLSPKPAGTQNKRLSGAKNRVRFLFYRSPDALDTAKTYKFETVLKGIKGKRQQSKAVDKEALPTAAEIRDLIAEIGGRASDKRTLACRLPLFIDFLLQTGCRVSEMTGIKLSDLKDMGDHIRVRLLGKGNKERMNDVDSRLIQQIREVFRGQEYLFETGCGKSYRREYVSNQIKKAGKRVLEKNISAHTLRHVFATTALKAGWSAKKIAGQLGHSSTSITLDMYVQDSPTWQDLNSLWGQQGGKTD